MEEAEGSLTDLGLVVRYEDARHDPSGEFAAGTVLAQDPPPGTELEEGQVVTLVPSLGPPPVPIPEVTGVTLAKARKQLSAAGLEVGKIIRRYHPTASEGSVFRQEPATGEAPRGSGVDLWVSRGHAPVTVPEVTGSTQEAAEEILRGAGFKVTVITAFSEDVERGRVAEVSPAEGSEAAFESAVTITVSIGPEHFPVPDLRGLTPNQARARADELGLEVDVFLVPGTPQTQVLSQTPSPGTTVTYGDTITLFVA